MQLNSYLKGDEYRQNILVNKIKYIVTTTKKKNTNLIIDSSMELETTKI
jgi:hypothetical protein